jgi:FG-GAP repeat protein
MSFPETRSGPTGWARRAALVAAPVLAVGMGALWAPISATPAAAQETATWAQGHQTAELHASDGAAGDNFGGSVAIAPDGSTAVVGAFNRDLHTGVAFVYIHKGKAWKQVAELTAADGAAYDYFGYSVAVSSGGSTVLVGAYAHDGSTGAVYVFSRHRKTWTQTDELTGADSIAGDAFGYAMEISADGTSAMIGAPDRDGYAGAVYTFSQTDGTWAQTGQLTASDAGPVHQFGYTIAVSADDSTAVIGSPDNNDLVGVAYVFSHRSKGWKQTAEFTSSDGASLDEFGYSVGVSSDGSTAVIGAYGHANYTGSAYVFTRSGKTWAQSAELSAAAGAEYDNFGYSVALSSDGSTAMVGAPGSSDLTGAVYVFADKGATWKQSAQLSSSDGASFDEFGYSMSLLPNGKTALLGSYGHDNGTGAAYLFHK